MTNNIFESHDIENVGLGIRMTALEQTSVITVCFRIKTTTTKDGEPLEVNHNSAFAERICQEAMDIMLETGMTPKEIYEKLTQQKELKND